MDNSVEAAGDMEDTATEKLKIWLENSLQENEQSKEFVPLGELREKITKELVSKVLLENSIEAHQAREIASQIVPGAIKTFATLVFSGTVRHILIFIERRELQEFGIDGKLPLEETVLREYGLRSHEATRFYKEQWKFTAPVFDFGNTLPTILHDKTVLPFQKPLKDPRLGEGGFGVVEVVVIEPRHQEVHYPIVRKQLPASEAPDILKYEGRRSEYEADRSEYEIRKSEYEAELRNLSILKSLRHPNIVQLLAAYSYNKTYSFIFPKAEGNLQNLFDTKPSSPHFDSSESLLLALAGLSSAIRAMHDDVGTVELKQMGCHRDLKPSNILLHDSRLILADFGLSRIKDAKEDSGSKYKMGHGDYIAPECEDLHDKKFMKHTVHRSSDIWSFGCIILEMLTYMKYGSSGIVEFREKRTDRTQGWYAHHRFCCGPGKPNTNVLGWHAKLDEVLGSYDHGHLRNPQPLERLSTLARDMLSLDHKKRPKAVSVEARLRCFAVDALSQSILKGYECISQTDLAQPLIEKTRFGSWIWACKINAVETNCEAQQSWTGDSFLNFENIVQLLNQVLDQLKIIEPVYRDRKRRYFYPLTRLNNVLLDMLPVCRRDQAKDYYESSILEPQDADDLHHLASMLTLGEPLRNLAQIKVKCMQIQAIKAQEHGCSDSPYDGIDPSSLQEVRWIGDLCAVRQSGTEPNLALHEFKTYAADLIEHPILDILFQRIKAIARLLNQAEPFGFRVLRCRGYCHDPLRLRSGLLYEFPRDSNSNAILDQAAPLDTILRNELSHYQKPMLGERFAMAHSLGASLYAFHKVSWLQRSITSTNIVFFHGKDSPWDPSAFFFLGFTQSRPDGGQHYSVGPPDDYIDDYPPLGQQYSVGPSDDCIHNYYVDPGYMQSLSFEHRHDYYALGIVLLEVGLWGLLRDCWDGLKDEQDLTQKNASMHSKFKEHAVNVLVPKLGPLMGAVYRDVVKACLDGTFREETDKGGDTDTGEVSVHWKFKKLVVEGLAQCSA